MLDCAESNRPRHWSGLSCSRQPNNRVIFYDPYSGFLSDPCAHGFPTNACGATHLLAIRYLQLWCQPMGPLCLWQCFTSIRNDNLHHQKEDRVPTVNSPLSTRVWNTRSAPPLMVTTNLGVQLILISMACMWVVDHWWTTTGGGSLVVVTINIVMSALV